MKKFALLLFATGIPALALAQEQARVISSTPVVIQDMVPTQVCSTNPTVVEQPKSGAGAALGAIAGGVAGNAVGRGSGNAIATLGGVVGGALLGDRIEGPNTSVQNVTSCTTQMEARSRTVYNVIYEYGGRQHSVQMPSDPGPTLLVQVSPVGMAPNAAPPPTAVAPQAQPVYVAPYPPGYYYPPYYYYPPFSIGVGVGFHGRHWH